MPVKIYKPTDQTWTNAAGDNVPVKFVPAPDKTREAMAGNIYKSAMAAEAMLTKLYQNMSDAFAQVRVAMLQEFAIKGKEKKPGKGYSTWYNFDRSLKVEAEVNDVIKWDGPLMQEAQELLDIYLSHEMSNAESMVKELVKSAFAGANGGPDTRKVFQILKYKSKIKHRAFQKACELIVQAQGIDKTKLYMRVWEKSPNGEYRNINLNFSHIKDGF